MAYSHSVAFVIVICLLSSVAARQVDFLNFSKSSVPATSTVPVVSHRAELENLAEKLATQHREVVLSTFKISPEGAQDMLSDILRNFAHGLNTVGLLRHTLLVAMDSFTADFAADRGVPCVLDGIMPTLYADERPGAIVEGFDPVVSKWLWTQQLVEMDYNVLFLDWDMSVLKNPLEHLDLSYDIQGLSDFHNPPKDVGKLKVGINDPGHKMTKLHPSECPLAALYGGKCNMCVCSCDLQCQSHNFHRVADTLTPCQSTGVYMIRAGATTQRFLHDFVTELLANTPGWWEQAAFNEFLPSWTMGIGMQAPLRYRLLPYRQYMNVGVWHKIGEQADPSHELVVVHAGYVFLPDKVNALKDTGHFHPELWDPKEGKELLSGLINVLSTQS